MTTRTAKPKHPGKTSAQRRALDEIGCGTNSPIMASSTRDALLKAGLIVKCGEKIFGAGPLAVHVDEYEMPVHVHMAWCNAMTSECEAVETGGENG